MKCERMSKEHKKQELINFIINYKLKHVSKEERDNTLELIKNKSYADLREWAIRNDFID